MFFKKLQIILQRQALLTIYKSFVRTHLDYGDIVYDQPKNEYHELCSCCLEPEFSSHLFFLCCHHYTILRTDLMNDLKIIDENLLRLSEKFPSSRTNFADSKYNRINSYHILNASINFVLRSERFNGSII